MKNSSEILLQVKNLKKTYRKSGLSFKKVEAVKGISFEVYAGQITGFLGANGAGKTTTIKCLLDLAYKDSGEISFFGSPVLNSEAKSKIGFLPERPYFYEYLTGKEFLNFYGELSNRWSRVELDQKIERLLGRVGLGAAKDRPLRSYSKGMLQRVGIAQALLHDPQFVILDEPMTGLDPDGRWEVNEIIKETAHSGTAVFFSSHLLNDAEKICQNLVVLKKGELIFQGQMREFTGQFKVSYSIRYKENELDMETQSVECDSLQEVQNSINSLQKNQKWIVSVKENQMSLEEAFVKVAFGESSL